MKRTIPCSQCGKTPVEVSDYMEGDEHEVVCDECEGSGLCEYCGQPWSEKHRCSGTEAERREHLRDER